MLLRCQLFECSCIGVCHVGSSCDMWSHPGVRRLHVSAVSCPACPPHHHLDPSQQNEKGQLPLLLTHHRTMPYSTSMQQSLTASSPSHDWVGHRKNHPCDVALQNRRHIHGDALCIANLMHPVHIQQQAHASDRNKCSHAMHINSTAHDKHDTHMHTLNQWTLSNIQNMLMPLRA